MDEAEKLCDRVAVVDHGRMIAQGSPRELMHTLGGDHVIELQASASGGGPLRAADLQDLPALRSVHEEAGTLVLTVTEPHLRPPFSTGCGRGLRSRQPDHAPREPRGTCSYLNGGPPG
jgi:ABC-2 type transport system ATP-binding protein